MNTLTPGYYTARGVTGALGNTSQNLPQVAVELEILDEGYQGERITWFGSFSERAEDRTLEQLRLLGWEGDDLDNLVGIDRNEVRLTVEEDTYDGKTRIKAAWINAKGGLALKAPMVPEEARAFAAKMRAKAAASRLKMGGAAPSSRPANGSAGAEKDIPF